VGVAIIATTVRSTVGNTQRHDLALTGGFIALGLVSAPLPLLRERRRGRRARARDTDAFDVVCGLMIWIFVAGAVATTNGIDGPLWVLFPLLVLMAAGTGNPLQYGAMSLSSAGALLVIAAAQGDFNQAHAAAIATYSLATVVVGIVGGLIASFAWRNFDATERARTQLSTQVEQMSEILQRAAKGDLGVRVEDNIDHEHLKLLGEAFNNTLSSLHDLVGQIRAGGEQITASATELLAQAETHAAGASQQSSAVSETTSTIEELAATAAQIAETADSVARYATETLRCGEQGRAAVDASVGAMAGIVEHVDSIAGRARTLGEKSQQIGHIINVIDELADQTNLLALNAAIEAARAGEHGRGFAVVAAEVRKLAERAQESTGQIKQIVSEIRDETQATIVATEQGSIQAHEGSQLAQAAVTALERIAAMVEETTTAAREISIATQQQRSASEQVVSAMSQVSDVSRQSAQGTRQTAAAVAQLNQFANGLRSSIARFTVA
jgi:methyl-accepting chemotaxis protein